jgi:hypothetical protein
MNSRRLMGAYPKAKDHEPIIAWCIAAESGHLSPVRVTSDKTQGEHNWSAFEAIATNARSDRAC